MYFSHITGGIVMNTTKMNKMLADLRVFTPSLMKNSILCSIKKHFVPKIPDVIVKIRNKEY